MHHVTRFAWQRFISARHIVHELGRPGSYRIGSRRDSYQRSAPHINCAVLHLHSNVDRLVHNLSGNALASGIGRAPRRYSCRDRSYDISPIPRRFQRGSVARRCRLCPAAVAMPATKLVTAFRRASICSGSSPSGVPIKLFKILPALAPSIPRRMQHLDPPHLHPTMPCSAARATSAWEPVPRESEIFFTCAAPKPWR